MPLLTRRRPSPVNVKFREVPLQALNLGAASRPSLSTGRCYDKDGGNCRGSVHGAWCHPLPAMCSSLQSVQYHTDMINSVRCGIIVNFKTINKSFSIKLLSGVDSIF